MTASITELLEYLYSLERAGIKLGLEPTRQLLTGVGHPEKLMPITQIAGTNGKGSTAAILHAILLEHGQRVGLYTSPHLYHFNERIRINGKCITDGEIAHWLGTHRELLEELEATFFEATTVMALSHFANNKVDHAILETGLGGRLDSTTAAGASLTALTPISYDHMEILGATLTKIAGEKAAIMRRGVACVSVPQRPEVRAVLMQRASEVGAKLEFLDVSENRVYPAKLAGEHQMLNGQLAWRLAELALGAEFSPTRAMAALGKIRWPGRYQVVSTRPLTVYDVGHNPHGIKTFVETFRGEHSKGPKILVLALQADKNISHILDQLIGQFTTVIMTETGTRKFVAANELAEAFPDAKAAVYVECEPGKAVEMAQDQAGESGIIAILGSHYLGPTVAKSFKISFDKLY